tara:strand:+ start:104 stop:1903 length:1800 start_codon:yes stop_codon:yes gene_type:complete
MALLQNLNHVGGDDVVNTGEYYDPQTRGLARLVHRFAFGEFFSALFYAIISSGAVLASGVLTMRLENSQHTAGRLLMIALANGLGFAALLYTLDAYRDAHFRYDERQNFVALQVHAEVWVQVNASTGWCVPQNKTVICLLCTPSLPPHRARRCPPCLGPSPPITRLRGKIVAKRKAVERVHGIEMWGDRFDVLLARVEGSESGGGSSSGGVSIVRRDIPRPSIRLAVSVGDAVQCRLKGSAAWAHRAVVLRSVERSRSRSARDDAFSLLLGEQLQAQQSAAAPAFVVRIARADILSGRPCTLGGARLSAADGVVGPYGVVPVEGGVAPRRGAAGLAADVAKGSGGTAEPVGAPRSFFAADSSSILRGAGVEAVEWTLPVDALRVPHRSLHRVGHINPLITLACVLTGDVSLSHAVAFWIAQFFGSLIGCIWLSLAMTDAKRSALGMAIRDKSLGWFDGFAIEAMGTFVLVLAALFLFVRPHVSHRGSRWHATPLAAELAPLQLGLVLTALTMAAAPLTGASFNPARSIAPALLFNSFADIAVRCAFHYSSWLVAGGSLPPLLLSHSPPLLPSFLLPPFPSPPHCHAICRPLSRRSSSVR